MANKTVALLILVIFVIALGGCAGLRKQNDLEIQGLRNQISAMEAQLQAKDEEISALRETPGKSIESQTIAQLAPSGDSKKISYAAKAHPTNRQIQTALKNAGYDPGVIDGKIGRRTRQAITEFQKANNLNADGKVGPKTWGLLKKYLLKKEK